MKLNELITIASLTVLLGAQCAQAQVVGENAADEAELTMTLITDPEAQLPAAVTNRIELPASRSASASGELKSDNREGAPGLDVAAEANAMGREMSEAAQNNRENLRGKGLENRPELPNQLPNPPDRPEIPGPPNPPGPPGP